MHGQRSPISADRNASISPRSPPSFMIMSRACGVSTNSPTCEAMLPITSPPSATPTGQPVERRRAAAAHASASGVRSRGRRRAPAGPLREQARAEVAPRDQRVRADATPAPRTPAGRAAPTSGRRRTAGPAGPSRSATATTARSTCPRRPRRRPPAAGRRPPSTAAASPFAVRALSVTCAATAPTAANAMPAPAHDRPNANAPAAGRPAPIRLSAVSSASTTVRADGQQQRRGQRGVPADHGRAEQLQPAGLLLGAGVPHHREDRDQRRPARRPSRRA